MKELVLLITALKVYKEKWERRLQYLPQTEDNIRLYVKLNTQIYMANWIINSINGGLSTSHGTNICNILREEQFDERQED